MRPRPAPPGGARLALGVATATAALGVSLALRHRVGIWTATGGFALVTLPLLLVLWAPAARAALRPSARRLAVGSAAGVALAALSHLLFPVAAAIVPGLGATVRGLYAELAAAPGTPAALPVLAAVVLAEELAWRGPALDALVGRLGVSRGVLAQTGLYVLPQLFSGTPLLVGLAGGCGLVWGALRVRAGGLDAALACHLVWGGLVFLAFPVVG